MHSSAGIASRLWQNSFERKRSSCHDTRYDAGEMMQVDSGEGMRIQRSSWARAPLAHGRQLHGFIVALKGHQVIPCSRTGMWPLAVAVGASISNTCDVRREARSQLQKEFNRSGRRMQAQHFAQGGKIQFGDDSGGGHVHVIFR